MRLDCVLMYIRFVPFHINPSEFEYIRFFFFTHTPSTNISTLSLHDALPISVDCCAPHQSATHSVTIKKTKMVSFSPFYRSEEHTSELQSRRDLVCRLLLEKKKVYRCASASLIR